MYNVVCIYFVRFLFVHLYNYMHIKLNTKETDIMHEIVGQQQQQQRQQQRGRLSPRRARVRQSPGGAQQQRIFGLLVYKNMVIIRTWPLTSDV